MKGLYVIGRAVRRLVVASIGLIFVLGYLAAYVPPDAYWWVAPFGVFLPWVAPLVVVGVVIGGVQSVRRGSVGGVLLAVGVAVALGIRFGPSLASEASPALEADDLRLMTFNAPTHGPDPQRLAAAVAQVVDGAAPHVLALQEPFLRVMHASNRTHPDTTASPQVKALLRTYQPPATVPSRVFVHLPVVGRVALDSLSLVRLDAAGTESYDSYAARVPFTWNGRRAVLYNVHFYTVSARKPWQEASWMDAFRLSFWRPFVSSYRTGALRRARQARQLRALIDAETVPVIVAGDFNSTPHHWVFRHVAAGLQDAHTTGGRGTGATYPATLPLVRIDHVLVDPAWTVVSSRVLPDHAFSDHRPVVVHLRWRE